MKTQEHNQTASASQNPRAWKVAKAKTNLEIIDCDGDVVATIRDNWHTQAQWELARLIAAGPTLLKSLRELQDIIENEIGYRLDSEYEHERRYAQSMIDAREAIQKAEARQ